MLGTADENEIQEVENHLLKGILLKRRSLTPLITIVKIVQELNPSERRIPQDASDVTTKDVGFSV
jgi:type II secretory ATPase GspE/PulE/Tfp pilus assembly ATPase PilB-like protein